MARHYYRLNGQIVAKICNPRKGTCRFVPVDTPIEGDSPIEVIIEDI